MYTEKNLKDDLYNICSTYYVKFKLLADYAYHRMDLDTFSEELSEQKSEEEIDDILQELHEVFHKIQQNGGKLDPDPLTEATRLRKAGKLREAYDCILPYIQAHPKDENAVISFGWVMYNILKETENNIDSYCRNLELFNQYATISFTSRNEYMNTLKNAFLWSIRRVASVNELNANKVFKPFIQFCGDGKVIFKKRRIMDNQVDSARLLMNDFLKFLSTTNYLKLIQFIGFEWFDRFDYQFSSFTNEQGEIIKVRPLAERVLNLYAKRLISTDGVNSTAIQHFLAILERELSKNPTYEWLPYYKIKLLIKNNNHEGALEDLTTFALQKSKDFWVWDLLSEVVPDDKKLACFCKGLLCKSQPEMLVSLQEKAIPRLVALELFSNAKFEVDACIASRTKKGWPISAELIKWKSEAWYSKAEPIDNRDGLREYAKEAEKLVYKMLPETSVFVTYINEGKGVIHFAFFHSDKSIKGGYFYMDSIEESIDWKTDQSYKFKMVEDSKRENLFRVYEVLVGDENFVENFIQSGSGYIEKEDRNPFAFVDDAFISVKLVEQWNLSNGEKIEYEKKRSFNRKKNSWSWSVVEVKSVIKDDCW
ncbi:hypothetical protein J9303_16315 [Bacillaceae bacterium Marseille-Q3522]|nr:hypothetical protein [Bacillaceae bacterium Marseille-Q3522]